MSPKWVLPLSSSFRKVEVNLEYGSYQQSADPASSTTDDKTQLPGNREDQTLLIVLSLLLISHNMANDIFSIHTDPVEFHQELDIVLQMYPSIQMS